MNAPRLRRGQQVERNRERLLAAARRVFVERGFHAATLEAIAEAAGFSKGVVYSQFDSKADLFLVLLERRIEERAAENARAGSIAELLATARRATAAEPEWNLLLLEFRVHAARAPEINARYAELHARTAQRLASALREAAGSEPRPPAVPPEETASFVLALAAGVTLEDLVVPRAKGRDELFGTMVARALGVADGSTRKPAPRRARSATPRARRRP